MSRRTIVGAWPTPMAGGGRCGSARRRSAMVLVAEGAVWLLRPGDRADQPAPVSESDYFTPAQIERGRDYSDGQLWLFVGGLGARGRRAGRAGARAAGGSSARRWSGSGARPVLGAAAVGRRAVGRPRRRRPAGGHRGPRARGRLRDLDPGPRLMAGGRRQVGGDRRPHWPPRARRCCCRPGAPLPGAWWIPGTVAVGRSPPSSSGSRRWCWPRSSTGSRRSRPTARRAPQVLELARSAPGWTSGEVYRVDASRRVRSLNAYVDGIGSTRRVVLYDNLLTPGEPPGAAKRRRPRARPRQARRRARGLAFLIIVTPLGLLFAG